MATTLTNRVNPRILQLNESEYLTHLLLEGGYDVVPNAGPYCFSA